MQKPFSFVSSFALFLCAFDDDFCFERRRRHVDVVFSHCLPLINGIESKALAFRKFFVAVFFALTRALPLALFGEEIPTSHRLAVPPAQRQFISTSHTFSITFDEFGNGYSSWDQYQLWGAIYCANFHRFIMNHAERWGISRFERTRFKFELQKMSTSESIICRNERVHDCEFYRRMKFRDGYQNEYNLLQLFYEMLRRDKNKLEQLSDCYIRLQYFDDYCILWDSSTRIVQPMRQKKATLLEHQRLPTTYLS